MGHSIYSKPPFKNIQFSYNYLEEMTQIDLPQPALSHPLRYTRYVGPHCYSWATASHVYLRDTPGSSRAGRRPQWS